uniref:Uncharacterized protein n=1 Tax=Anguilla anguilla TaxID=7936 RepID=A0A0E9WFR7_ANGAN
MSFYKDVRVSLAYAGTASQCFEKEMLYSTCAFVWLYLLFFPVYIAFFFVLTEYM